MTFVVLFCFICYVHSTVNKHLRYDNITLFQYVHVYVCCTLRLSVLCETFKFHVIFCCAQKPTDPQKTKPVTLQKDRQNFFPEMILFISVVYSVCNHDVSRAVCNQENYFFSYENSNKNTLGSKAPVSVQQTHFFCSKSGCSTCTFKFGS